MRPKKGNELFNKNKHIIAFYDKNDEWYVNSFRSIRDICKFKNIELNKKNYDVIYIELLNALKRNPPLTRMLNGELMTVHLINLDENE